MHDMACTPLLICLVPLPFCMQLSVLEERSREDLANAETRFHGDMAGVQAQLKLLRVKQNRAMSYMGVVTAPGSYGGGPAGMEDTSRF